jgi:predicted N-formylglutamate amidohydrolase
MGQARIMSMAPQSGSKLLGTGDPPPVTRLRPAGTSLFLLLGDHAGCAIPSSLGDLGLPESERQRHIGWDIGVSGLGRALSARLDATFLSQHYSRLVIDCNRDPASSGAVPDVSDGTAIPGNAALSAADRAERVAAIHAPYHEAIARTLDARAEAARPTIVIALHSFTPVFGGTARPWHVGVLHGGGDARFARAVLGRLGQEAGLVVGDNEPYRMDGTDHSVPRHCFPRQLPYVELEVRQDLIAAPAQQREWAERLARMFTDAAALAQ